MKPASQIAHAKATPLATLAEFVQRGGPDPVDYDVVARCFQSLKPSDASEIETIFGPTLNAECIHGHSYVKPHGYSGDFEVIDKIYTGWISPNPYLRKWDQYFHRQSAPRAVRNRKQYFHSLLSRLDRAHGIEPVNILNVGCGPARDVAEYFTNNPDSKLAAVCLDIDPSAIRYGRELCSAFLDRVEFSRENILRYKPQDRFDLIWAAGVFDYFPDRVFCRVGHRLFTAVKPGGQLVIGNFSSSNPCRSYMELLGRWHLNHRAPGDLRTVGEKIAANGGCVTVESEPEGVNLFLCITSPATPKV